MIVADASAVVELLVGRTPEPELFDCFTSNVEAPHLLDVEVLSVLRGLTLGGKLSPQAMAQARRHHFDLTIERHEVEPFSERILQLRHQFTSYDACYLALAEALDVPLITCDAKLAKGGHGAEVIVFPNSQA